MDKELDKIEFFYPSFSEILSSAQSQISNQFLHSQFLSKPCSGGLIDFKLGSFENSPCMTCFKNYNQCSGHFGYIKLFLPVFNIGYLKTIHGILQIICKNCSRVLLKGGKEYQKIMKLVQLLRKKDKFSRIKSMSLIIEYCRRVKLCPHCNCKNGKIRKIGAWTFIHELEYTDFNPSDQKNFSEFEINKVKGKNIILDPLKVFLIFLKIERKDYILLDLDPSGVKPENFLLSVLPVPPLVVRPTVSISPQITNEDDLTMRLVEIQTLNLKLKKLFSFIEESESLWEIWSILQIECARYLNSEIFTNEIDSKNLTGIYQRLKGKNGRFRGSLGGKRVDFSGRTVISPDPNIELNSVGIPLKIALKLTFPEKITKFNQERLRRCILRGPNLYPGANYLIVNRLKKNLSFTKISSIITKDLKEGNVVERHIKDNEIILFNRQPSLHRISIMAHRVKVMTGKTFRLNECVCKPYNADFDGDEMNIHIPQTQKARAEAISLMNPIKNSKTPRNGEPTISSTQDFLTFSYLLTSKNCFFLHHEIFKIIGFFHIEDSKKNWDFPAILKPVVLWTGKQLFSWVFFSFKVEKISSSFETKNSKQKKISNCLTEKSYSLSSKQCFPYMCPFDGWVIIRNNQLLSGRIGKNSIGSGNKNSLSCIIENNFSDYRSAFSFYNLSRLTYEWFSDFGFTVSLDDVIPDSEKKNHKKYLIACLVNLNSAVKFLQPGKLTKISNFTQRDENKIKSITKRIRLKMGLSCLGKKEEDGNSLQVMFTSGSKGSLLNLAQMISCLGQQTVNGKRINGDLFKTRIANKKKKPGNNIILNGFVKKSFYQGLDSLEFFFHAMAGREGLVDTAVKTAETGYIQRKLSKTLEDLVVLYDSTVRTSCGRLIQFNYGEDDLSSEKASRFSQIYNLQFGKIQTITKNEFKKSKNSDIEIFVKSHSLLFTNCSFFTNSFRSKFLKIKREYGFFIKIPPDEIENFLRSRMKILNQLLIESGTSVGAIAAQSIGEPCTQMTLQTFHSAGTGSVNITLGVPKINEIINVSKGSQNSKIIATHLSDGYKLKIMKLKIRMQKLKLGKLIKSIKISFQNSHVFTFIEFKKQFLLLSGIPDIYQLVYNKIKKNKGLWKNSIFFLSRKKGEIRIIWSNQVGKKNNFVSDAYNLFNFCKMDLQEIILYGKFNEKNLHFFPQKNFTQILINDEDLLEVLTIPFLNFSSVKCDHIHKVNQVLGIEATRLVIIEEIERTFSSNGIFTDLRHLTLLTDVITYQGELIGITRHGLPRIKSNTLALASFEKTVENLFSAASSSSRDFLAGVSENIIIGKEPPVGTGLVTLHNKL